ncbi:DNA replication/repair protein RecF [Benzoatithermus flavus]|uniref:DNA replication and repair protein RecF n=1 Tax=Benzoatithermus flavus TaxID=3108223 RepID=A0ABU8XPT4_9PROT
MTLSALSRREAGASAQPARALAIRRLELENFRNYRQLRLELGASPVILHGENGAGKTNLLEAVSLLTPGRGLRRARLADLDREGGSGSWHIDSLVDGHAGPAEIATARDPEAERRTVEVDGQALRSQTGLGEFLSLVWLTPAMDRLFSEGASGRRRFLDRLVLAIDPEHATRVAAFERALRERSHLLRAGRRDPAWLAAIEQRMAESAVAVAAARRELVHDLDAALRDAPYPFPRPRLALEGEVESWLGTMPALEAEQRLVNALASSRAQDAETGGAAVGPHRSDLVASDAFRGEPAQRSSTGRQKAFLISIVLAEARLRQARHGDLPILLLDEVTAHLDPRRRAELLAALVDLGAQAWLTGTDAHLFAPLAKAAQMFHVVNGALTPHE